MCPIQYFFPRAEHFSSKLAPKREKSSVVTSICAFKSIPTYPCTFFPSVTRVLLAAERSEERISLSSFSQKRELDETNQTSTLRSLSKSSLLCFCFVLLMVLSSVYIRSGLVFQLCYRGLQHERTEKLKHVSHFRSCAGMICSK